MTRRVFLAAVSVVLLLILAVPVIDTLLYRDVIHPGVTIWGVDVGGRTIEEARALLSARASQALSTPLELRHDGGRLTVVPQEDGVRIDVDGAVHEAAAVSGEGRYIAGVPDRLRLWLGPRDVDPTVFVEPSADGAWQVMLDEAALAVERLPKDARLILTDDGPKAVAAEEGVRLDRSLLAGEVLQAVARGEVTVDIPVSRVAPVIDTEEARQALNGARVAFSAPVDLGYQGTTFSLSPEDLQAIAAVNPGGVSSGLPLTFDTQAATELLTPKLATVAQPPVDAKIEPDPDGRGLIVIPGQDGTVVEWEALTGALARAALSVDRRYVPIPTTPSHPKLSTLDALEFSKRREIASFTTYFSPANQARVNNIRQVSSSLDGVLIGPGETFSFNGTVGPRTRAAGYDEAPVIRDGTLTPGVGGGICQVSTTLFNAAFFAGLPIVERHPHSFYIDHYPVGRDATVSYGSADLRFRNDSDEFILVTVEAAEDSVTVSLAASDWGRTVEYDTTPFSDLVPPRSSADTPRRLRDPALAAGQVSAVEAGVDGRTVEVQRRVTGSDGSVLFADEFVSTYQPKDYIVRVGG